MTEHVTDDSPCVTVVQDDSSGIVQGSHVGRTDFGGTSERLTDRLDAGGKRDARHSGSEAVDDSGGAAPTTADAALRLAIKLAVDASDFDTAAVLLEAAKRTKPRAVRPLEAVRRRDEETGKR